MNKRTKNKIAPKFKEDSNPLPRRPRSKLKAVGKPQFWIDSKMGFSPVLCWCCGAMLLLDYYTDGPGPMGKRLVQFQADHEACWPDDYALCPLLIGKQEGQAS